ncbi:hypothetical protein P3H15_31540 [Rhodococcus sp. T2V]|uniref:hypothetical protein n=1 Tax=Rhodococcus sp. T2V TaxID=3034164 RepID=UPI0023E1FBC3|nr:hypothetical protein [Rhodococcus sp. T2V]MDF3309554.1 hypothetical protein [Rhodococcus sp. T2V]
MATEVAVESVDELHLPPTDSSPWLTETAWYSFWTTDHVLAGHVYLRFRPNLGVMDAFTYVWGPGVSSPWDTAYWKDVRLGMPTSLLDLEIPGLSHTVVDPFREYRLTSEDERGYGDRFAFDLSAKALQAPTYFGGKHLDQPMHMTGWVTVDGTRRDVDCFAMRDRSWYRRSDFTLFRSAYSYALGGSDDGFLALYAAPRDLDMLRDDLPLVGGHETSATGQRPFSSGVRKVTKRDPVTGHPMELTVAFEEEGGGTREVRGRVRNSIALAANTSMLSWMSLVDWDVDGRIVVGEDQEIWSPSIWRAFRGRSYR